MAKKSDGQEPAATTFTAAMQELEQILRRIEGEEVDIDRLGAELARATELVELCRAKIRRAEAEVTQIVQRLEAPAAGGDPES